MSCLSELIRRRIVHPAREMSPCAAREPGFLSFPNGLLGFLALTNGIETLTHRDGYAPVRCVDRGLALTAPVQCMHIHRRGTRQCFSLPGGGGFERTVEPEQREASARSA
jgi:hypothetical protein